MKAKQLFTTGEAKDKLDEVLWCIHKKYSPSSLDDSIEVFIDKDVRVGKRKRER